jgi:hypothetical protein
MAAKGVKASKTTKSKSGMTAAQNKAFQAASKKAIATAQLQHNAKTLQARRLQGAAKAHAKLAAKGAQLFSARIKVAAVSQTYRQIARAHQAKSLRVQAAHNLFKAQSLATNRQFAYSGEAIHAHTTTMQTLTDAQALAAAQRLSNAARKRIVSGASKKKPKPKVTTKVRAKKSPYTAVGQAAGRAAAARVGKPKVQVKKARAKTTAKASASKHRKAAGLTRAVNPVWITAGNDEDKENCVLVAIANHCLLHTGYRVPDGHIDYLSLYNAFSIATALYRIDRSEAWTPVTLSEYGMVKPEDAKPGMIVGFETEHGPHCGVLLEGNMVVSWGEIVVLETEIEEAWEISWTRTTRP